MSTIHRSKTVTVFHDARGFVEWIVREHHQTSKAEIDTVALVMLAQGLSRVRVLISRVNDYGPPDDYFLHDLHQLGSVTIERAAFFAPSPPDQNRSHVIALTALRTVPTRVFADRQRAIDWLLSDESP